MGNHSCMATGSNHPQLSRSTSAPGLSAMRSKDMSDKEVTRCVRKHDSQPSIGVGIAPKPRAAMQKSESSRQAVARADTSRTSSNLDREVLCSPAVANLSDEEDRIRKVLDAKLLRALNKLGVAP